MPFIELDRRFFEWRSKANELSDPDILSRFDLSDGAKPWFEVLKRRRVVILAEAGSGKTEELKERRSAVAAEGKLVYATSKMSDVKASKLVFRLMIKLPWRVGRRPTNWRGSSSTPSTKRSSTTFALNEHCERSRHPSTAPRAAHTSFSQEGIRIGSFAEI